MKTEDILLLAVTLVILGEVTYLLAKLPKTSLKTKGRAILVDTSVLMDGRIISVASTGFIGGTLVIPRSVVGELQLLADGSDSDKRSRARYGLDVVTDLQKLENVEVELLQDGSRADEGVDERLLTLAKRHHASICTLDFNLNKVAAVEGIQVLNINELAQGLRMSHLPGDHVVIELVQKGQDNHQAVGYLPDGTMVVVEQSNAYIGKTVDVEVIRSLQTAAGKMMFAKRLDKSGTSPTPRKHASAGRAPQPKSIPKKHHTEKPASIARPAPKEYTTATPKPIASDRVEHDAPLHQKKSRRAYHAVPSKDPSTAATKPQATTAQPVSNSTSQRRRSNRRPDREAALIALVNKQQDQ
ncbi:MAG: TRAM domain-containing protein [Candidatus Saccharimonas sp.]